MIERERGRFSGAENRRLDAIEARLVALDDERAALCAEAVSLLARHPDPPAPAIEDHDSRGNA